LINAIKKIIGVALIAGVAFFAPSSQDLAYDPNEPGGGGQSIEPIEEEV